MVSIIRQRWRLHLPFHIPRLSLNPMSSAVTVIIPTYNGFQRLFATLPSLLHQSVAPYEYILVIDGSTDGTLEWINQQDLPSNFIVCSTPNRGRSRARNLGASLARTDLLIFVDDDIKVPPNFVERHQALQVLYPNSLISGDVRQDLNSTYNKDICAFRRDCDMRWAASAPTDHVSRMFRFTTQNLSIVRSVFLSLGGFDERLTDSEDFFLGVLAVKQSIPIYFDPTLVSYHCDYGDLDYLIRRNAEYIASKLRLAELCRDVRDNYSYVLSLPSSRSFIKKFARRFLVYNAFWRYLTHSRAFLSLPQSFRFKIYDYILSSSTAHRLGLI